MDRQRAINTLVAHACCCDEKLHCYMCPWNDTYDCENTKFSDVLYEAVKMINRGRNNEKNEIK